MNLYHRKFEQKNTELKFIKHFSHITLLLLVYLIFLVIYSNISQNILLISYVNFSSKNNLQTYNKS